MNAFSGRHPYRCLPLSIANAYGWEVLCPISVEAEWDGGPGVENLQLRALDPAFGGEAVSKFSVSNFSRGIVTFHIDYIFRTPPGWDLVVTGPANWPRENAAPLSGIIETDWLPYTFTMNYQMLRPGVQRWLEGEPYCVVFPVPKHALVDTIPEIRRLRDDPQLSIEHDMFKRARDDFMARWRAGDRETLSRRRVFTSRPIS
jgi:hypothetical protein